MRPQLILGFLLIFAGTSCFGTAYAAAITNLDKKPQSFEINQDGTKRKITIEPNRTWRTEGKARVSYNGREVSIDSFEEYAIWNDDTFGPQRTINNPTQFIH